MLIQFDPGSFPVSLFGRSANHLLVPDLVSRWPPRANVVKGGPTVDPSRERLALDGHEHGGMLRWSGCGQPATGMISVLVQRNCVPSLRRVPQGATFVPKKTGEEGVILYHISNVAY